MNLVRHDIVGPAPLRTAAPSVGLSPPQKIEAHRLAGAAGFEGQTKYDTADSDPTKPGRQQSQIADTQRFIRLRANFVKAEWTLAHCDKEASCAALFPASRWGQVRELPSFATVDAFASQIGAAL